MECTCYTLTSTTSALAPKVIIFKLIIRNFELSGTLLQTHRNPLGTPREQCTVRTFRNKIYKKTAVYSKEIYKDI